MADNKTADVKDYNNIDWVEAYAQAGYALFKLSGKHPAAKGVNWRKTLKDPDLTLLDMPGNFGIVIPSEILILDIDCKKNQPGKESYKKLLNDCGLPAGWESETFVVQTGSGGYHIYLSKDPKIKIKKKLVKDYPGIDFLSSGCYVVGVGSKHPDTAVKYQPVFGSPESVLPAPPTILDKIKKAKIEEGGVSLNDNFIDDDPLNVERFIDILRDLPGAPEGSRASSCYVAACRGRDLGLSKGVCLETILTEYNNKLEPPLEDSEIKQVIDSAYKYAQGVQGAKNVSSIFQTVTIESGDELKQLTYDTSAKGDIKPTLNNAVNYISTLPELAGMFKFNMFTGCTEISSSVPWYKQRGSSTASVVDEDITLLKYHLSRVMRVEFPAAILNEAVVVSAHKYHYHPVRNYLKGLVWDKVPRLDNWLITYSGAVDDVFTRAAGKKVLCAAVKRIFDPGCKWDYVLIIEGDQGIGKSTMCRILGRMWGGDMNLDPHSRDAVAMMSGKWVIELSEMVALRWADANALKSFITREKDTVRAAYARHAKDYLRQSVFIGTVNPEHVGYLHDVTGNRRFWVVNFPRMVDTKRLEQDCDQLWAEAVCKYKLEPLYLNPAQERIQAAEAKARMPEDPLRRHVSQYMAENAKRNIYDVFDIMEYLGMSATKVNKADQGRIAQALMELGCTRHREIIDGEVKSVFRKKVESHFE